MADRAVRVVVGHGDGSRLMGLSERFGQELEDGAARRAPGEDAARDGGLGQGCGVMTTPWWQADVTPSRERRFRLEARPAAWRSIVHTSKERC